MTRSRRPFFVCGCIFLAGWVLCLGDHLAAEPRVTISPETTLVVEPLREDGYVDYVTLLNDELSEGVAPEDNVLAGLVEIIGARIFPTALQPQYMALLEIEPPEHTEEPFSHFHDWLIAEGYSAEEIRAADREFLAELPEPRTPQNCPHLVRWLKEYEPAIDAMAGVVKRPRYYVPLVPEEDGGSLDSALSGVFYLLRPMRDMVDALGLRAVLRASTGDMAGATSDLQTAHRLARHMSTGPFVVDRLLGYAVESMIREYEIEILTASELTAAEAAGLRGMLQKLPPHSSVQRAYETGERYFAVDLLVHLCRSGPARLDEFRDGFFSESSLHISAKVDANFFAMADWDWLLRQEIALYAAQTKAIQAVGWPARAAAFEAINNAQDEQRAYFADPYALFWHAALTPPRRFAAEYIAEELARASGELGGNAPIMEVQGQTWLDLLQVATALAQYRASEGEYPRALESLAPQILSTVPLDRFTEQPLFYERTEHGYRLYSVGHNGVDDGGVETLPDGEWGDLVIEIDHGA